jgi:methionine sulfoxide reductase heme-binding subunit
MAGRGRSSPPIRLLRVPKLAVYLVGFTPAVWTLYLGLADRLGAEPIRELEHVLGLWALRFLLASLVVTPLRRLTRLDLLRFRRALGLLAFFYASLHLAAYVVLDQGLDPTLLMADLRKRPYVMVGMAGFALLVPLAITSNDAMVRRLGGTAWSRLQKLVYPAAILVAAHFILVVKSWPPEPLVYAAITAVLLGYRLARRVAKTRGAKGPGALARPWDATAIRASLPVLEEAPLNICLRQGGRGSLDVDE